MLGFNLLPLLAGGLALASAVLVTVMPAAACSHSRETEAPWVAQAPVLLVFCVLAAWACLELYGKAVRGLLGRWLKGRFDAKPDGNAGRKQIVEPLVTAPMPAKSA